MANAFFNSLLIVPLIIFFSLQRYFVRGMMAGSVNRRKRRQQMLLNSPGKNIPEATRRRGLAAANEAARTLAMSRRRSIGLLICHSQFVYTDAFIMRVVEGMSLAVNRARLQLVIQPISLTDARYMEIAERLGLEGFVLINAHDNDPGLEHIIRARIPAVAMDYLPEVPIDHLIELGHTRIAMITHADPVYAAARQRVEGYHDSLKREGIPPRARDTARWSSSSDASKTTSRPTTTASPASLSTRTSGLRSSSYLTRYGMK